MVCLKTLNEDDLAVNVGNDDIRQNNDDQFGIDESSDKEGSQFRWNNDLNAHVHKEDFENDFSAL